MNYKNNNALHYDTLKYNTTQHSTLNGDPNQNDHKCCASN